MKIEIIEKVENPTLKRSEIKFKVEHTGAPTPKRLEVRSQLAVLLGVAEEALVIDKLASTHGRQVASGIARTYSSKEQLDEIEPKYLLQRGLPKEAKPEEAPKEKPKKPEKEAKPEEKPKEAKPEKAEPKKEAKPEEKAKEKEVKEKPQKEEGKSGKGE